MEAKYLMEETNKFLLENQQLWLNFSKVRLNGSKSTVAFVSARITAKHSVPTMMQSLIKFLPSNTLLWSSSRTTHGTLMSLDCSSNTCMDRWFWITLCPVVRMKKTLITMLACCNKCSSEKMLPTVIESAQRPRTLKKKTKKDLSLHYREKKKAWTNTCLFCDWLHRFDAYMDNYEGMKILLLIDNRSAHGKKRTLLPLESFLVEFLFPNTTSKVHPLDASINMWIKKKNRRRLLLLMFNNIYNGRKSIYNVEIITTLD